MEHFAGIDVSLEACAVCVMDAAGRVVREAKVSSEPAALAGFFADCGFRLGRVGLEAGPLAPWLFEGLARAGVPVVVIETRRMKAFASASPVKTDRKDAEAIAQAMRVGLFREVHIKSRASLEARAVLTNRSLALRQRLQLQNTLRGTLKGFGLKLGQVSAGGFVARVREAIADQPMLQAAIEPLLALWLAQHAAFRGLDRLVRRAAIDDPVCRRLMTAPGIGPVNALAYRTGLDVPGRFRRSSRVGAYLGLTPRKYASGRIDRNGHITKCGDAMVRACLYEAANSILTRLKRPSALRDWATRLAHRAGMKRARVALARKLAVILHRMWLNEEDFREPLGHDRQALAA